MAEIRINATGGVKLYDADDSHYAQIIAGTISSNVDALTLGSSSATFNIPVTVGVDDTGKDVKFFGASAGAYALWDESANLLDLRGATAAGPGNLKLTTGELTVVDADVLGKIEFQAPLEGSGTDAILVGAAIWAEADDTFAAGVNNTDLVFALGKSEAAAEKFRFTADTEIGIGGANYGTDGQVLTSGGAGAAVAWEDAGGGADPSSADGDTLGTASLEWSDLYLADGSVIYFGNDQEITLTHSADSGLLLKHTATADDKPINLVLQTGETDMAADDVIGKISWQAPDEGTGTDAILVSAAIQAVAEGDHSSSSNATRLEFHTGASELATSQMTISSSGIVGIGAVPTGDLGVGLHIKTADSGASASGSADELVIEGDGDVGIAILNGTDQGSAINFGDSGDDNVGRIQYSHANGQLKLWSNATMALGIDDTANVIIGTSSMNQNERLYVTMTNTTQWTSVFINAAASNYGRVMKWSLPQDFDDTSSVFCIAYGGANERFKVFSDGDVQNADNSYGAISDARIKQDVRDANSQWDDIKALRVRNFKKKEDVRKYGDAAWEQIGLIAQETELVSPHLVEEAPASASDVLSDSAFGTIYTADDPETQDAVLYTAEDKEVIDGDYNIGDEKSASTKQVGDIKTTTSEKVKGMKYSVLYMKAIKALQEAQTRIETLEAKVAVLEG